MFLCIFFIFYFVVVWMYECDVLGEDKYKRKDTIKGKRERERGLRMMEWWASDEGRGVPCREIRVGTKAVMVVMMVLEIGLIGLWACDIWGRQKTIRIHCDHTYCNASQTSPHLPYSYSAFTPFIYASPVPSLTLHKKSYLLTLPPNLTLLNFIIYSHFSISIFYVKKSIQNDIILK